jgi:glycosyltransferase involved in cell wall biosynthesis
MRITFLTQYYPPETGAPQNRLHSLALHTQAAGHQVEVITAMPNYPQMRIHDEYRGKLLFRESIDGIAVLRVWIFVSQSKTVVARMSNYLSFVATSLMAGVRAMRSDFLLCESPPLFLGISAFILAKLMGARLVFNVSDLWPKSAKELGIVQDGMMLRAAYRLEAWIYRRSFLVTGQTQGIVSDIDMRFPKIRTYWLPNGVDEDVYAGVQKDGNWRSQYGLVGKRLFVYAGILGYAQGLDTIVRAASRMRNRSDIAFLIIGDGPLKQELEELNSELSARVVFVPHMPKVEVLRIVADAYAYIVVLRKLDLFKGAIPSKLFDPLALGVPILLGVEGEAKKLFIDDGCAGIAFEPENDEQLTVAVNQIYENAELRDELGANGHSFVNQHFNRKNIAASLLDQLKD